MKPTNYNEDGCDPISSNCVIWQGPDIECINLCKGDTVSDVVYKLATELCTLLDTFDVSNYDTSCFNLLECAPEDFAALIQLLIDKICACCDIEPTPGTPGATGCPDCVVEICSDFYYTNPQGDTVTTMQLSDYVLAIGNKVCSLIGQIGTINATLNNHEIRISALEAAPDPVFTLPQIVPACVITPAVATDIDVVLQAVEQQFCELRTYTGTTVDILAAINKACAGLNTSDKLSGTGQMQDLTGWYSTPTTLSDSFANLWQTVCDIRTAVFTIQANCCDTGCAAIDLIVAGTAISPTEIQLYFTGSIPAAYSDQVIGSSLVLTDTGGGGPQTTNGVLVKQNYFDLSAPLSVTLTSVDGTKDVILQTTYRFEDPVTGSTCEGIVQSVILGTDTCPTLTLVPGYIDLDYSFAWSGVLPTVVEMQLWNQAGTTMISSHALNITSIAPSGTFVSLTEGTSYLVRVVISGEPCEYAPFTTLAYPCTAPSITGSTIDYTDPEGSTNGTSIAGWIIEYESFHAPCP